MQVHEAHDYAQRFFTSANAGSYDSVSNYATFGQDRRWKHKILDAVGTNETILELACGTGILGSMFTLAKKQVVGLDLTFEYLAQSNKKHSLPVIQGTAELLPYRDASFDAVVSSYLAKYVDTMAVASECRRVLRPGGIAVFHDFTCPPSRIMRMFWRLYFGVLRFSGLFIPSWREAFEHLDSVIEESRWEIHMLAALKECGFGKITLRYYTAGTAAIVTAEKP